MLIKAKLIFFFKNLIWLSKNAEFLADFQFVEKVLKMYKKVISKNVTEICTFSTFTHVRQTCLIPILIFSNSEAKP